MEYSIDVFVHAQLSRQYYRCRIDDNDDHCCRRLQQRLSNTQIIQITLATLVAVSIVFNFDPYL